MPLPSLWAVLASLVLSIVLGFLWYGPLFGKKWMTLSGIVMPERKPSFSMMLKPIIMSLVGALFITYVLSFVITFHNLFYQTSGIVTALSVALLVWVGFIVPVYLNLSGWEGKPWALFFINVGYWLVFLLIAASFLVVIP